MDLSKGNGTMGGWLGGQVGLLRGARGVEVLGRVVSLHHRVRCYRGSSSAIPAEPLELGPP